MISVNGSQRLIRRPLISASRIEPAFGKVRTSHLTLAQANGVRYENKVFKALSILAKNLDAKIERNPWFKFMDANGEGICSPDVILSLGRVCLVIEVKTTWVPTARAKLSELYVPVVNLALEPAITRSLIICKNLTPESPRPIENLCSGTQGTVFNPRVYQWLGQGPIVW